MFPTVIALSLSLSRTVHVRRQMLTLIVTLKIAHLSSRSLLRRGSSERIIMSNVPVRDITSMRRNFRRFFPVEVRPIVSDFHRVPHD